VSHRPALRRLRRGEVVLLTVDPRFEAPARALGLLEPGGASRLLADRGARAGGRGPTARVTLPDPDAQAAAAGGCEDRPSVLLRPVRHGGLLGPLLGDALWGLGRPAAELRVTAALRAAGAPVPIPAFVVGERRGGPLWRAAVATVFEAKAVDARRLLESNPSRAELLALAAAAGRAVRRFHDAGGRHRDLHLENLLVRDVARNPQVVLVDLDRARQVARVPPRARMAELMRLYRSLVKRGLARRVGSRPLARFLSAYTGGDRALRRALRAHLPRERLRIALHALTWPPAKDEGRS